jgi:hypothetical protein
MRPIKTAESNIKYVADSCDDLPARHEPPQEGVPAGCVSSVWEPTPEERAEIAAGANIKLWVWARSTPPVAITTTGLQEIKP